MPAPTSVIPVSPVTLDDLWDVPPDGDLPPLDRADATPSSLLQQEWCRSGRVILPGLLDDDLIDRYSAVWRPQFADNPTLYLRSREARALCLHPPLVAAMSELIGEPMGLHLNLAGWTSTERDWHQDDYLNPPYINGHYVAVWLALGDIHPDSGPFQCVPGSHRWPIIRREKILQAMGEPLPYGNDADWPKRSEDVLSPLFEKRFADMGLEPETFLAKRGDVLIWHSRLAHRGSRPNVPGMERRALIAHYSALSHRVDMPHHQQQGTGSFFVLGPYVR